MSHSMSKLQEGDIHAERCGASVHKCEGEIIHTLIARSRAYGNVRNFPLPKQWGLLLVI